MIYAISSVGPSLESGESITRRFGVAVSLLALALGTATAAPVRWRDAPEYVRLVAPAVHKDAYHARVTTAELDTVLAEMAGDPSLLRSPGSWVARRQHPLAAFGRSGSYNRWRMALVYGGREPRVARGTRIREDGGIEAWTLVSPYPDLELETLRAGTLVVQLRVP